MCKTNTVPSVEQTSRVDWLNRHREWTGKDWLQKGPSPFTRFIKTRKRRLERRKAKIDPETLPTYGAYRGYD